MQSEKQYNRKMLSNVVFAVLWVGAAITTTVMAYKAAEMDRQGVHEAMNKAK